MMLHVQETLESYLQEVGHWRQVLRSTCLASLSTMCENSSVADPYAHGVLPKSTMPSDWIALKLELK